MDITRLLLFTAVWTAVWVAPLPRLPARAELVAGLVPFVAFGLRVFAGFFVGVPHDDAVRAAVAPLLDWIDGRSGFPPYAWVLDATVALGLAWFAMAFDIPRRARIATAWIMPIVAALAVASDRLAGQPLERFAAAHVPPPLLAALVGAGLGAGIRWTPAPLPAHVRRRAAAVALVTVPAGVVAGCTALAVVAGLPPERAAQAQSIVALATGAGAALAGWTWGGFARPRSRGLFAMAVGVAAGALVALAA